MSSKRKRNRPARRPSNLPAPSPARSPTPDPQIAPSAGDKRVQHKSWAGPLPSPESLQQFGEIVDNGVERAVSMTEREQAERHRANRAQSDRDDKELQANIEAVKRSQIIDGCAVGGGMAILLACVAGAIYLATIGATVVACVLVGVPVMTAIVELIRRFKK